MYAGAGVAVRFEIDFYVTETGRAPVLEWLEGLKRRSPNLHALVLAGINKLKDREYHAPPLSEHVGGDLFELRVGGKDTARVLYFFRRGRRIVLLHGFVKKSQALPGREKDLALQRLTDYVRRNPND
jgi:phage-related protein